MLFAKIVFALGAFVHKSEALQWGRFPIPAQLRLTQVGSQLQTADASTGSGTKSIVERINDIIESANTKIQNSQTLVTAQTSQLDTTEKEVEKTITAVTNNEEARIQCVKDYNKNAISLNGILVDMTTGTQQINDVISVANRVQTNLNNDIKKINEAISVTNDWLVKMDNWVTFVKSETEQIDTAQANLITWGDSVRKNINTHEEAALSLAKTGDDLETQVSDLNNVLLATGALLGYKPATLTIAEASGGFGWLYTAWS